MKIPLKSVQPFQRLYGINRQIDRQAEIVKNGLVVYVPYIHTYAFSKKLVF